MAVAASDRERDLVALPLDTRWLLSCLRHFQGSPTHAFSRFRERLRLETYIVSYLVSFFRTFIHAYAVSYQVPGISQKIATGSPSAGRGPLLAAASDGPPETLCLRLGFPEKTRTAAARNSSQAENWLLVRVVGPVKEKRKNQGR